MGDKSFQLLYTPPLLLNGCRTCNIAIPDSVEKPFVSFIIGSFRKPCELLEGLFSELSDCLHHPETESALVFE